MGPYTAEFESLEEQRLEFALAEKLFDLPTTVIRELLVIQRELDGLSQIYHLYKEFAVCISMIKFVNLSRCKYTSYAWKILS